MAVEALPTDTLFGDSPDNDGSDNCLCSRCLKPIPERDVPLRMWPTVGGKVSHYEYRYCEKCMQGMGIILGSRDDEDDTDYDYENHFY